jgi:phage gp36-like protein
MAYALTADMISRFGAAEMVRLSTPSDQEMDQVVDAPVTRALGDASDTIDTYLRKRYQVPLTIVPPAVARACCILARYDLYFGDNREPTEQVRLARKEVIEWLVAVADGAVLLDLDEVESGDDSYAQAQTRCAVFRDGAGAGGSAGGAWPAASDWLA